MYTGCEADITTQTGGYWDYIMAPILNAHVIFIEHRYFGESMPFENQNCYTENNIQYLTYE